MEPIHYLHLQLRLEGKEVVDGGFLREVEAVPGEDMPLMLLAELADRSRIAYYDERLPGALQERLAACFLETDFPATDALLLVLKEHGTQFEVGHYKTYVFPLDLTGEAEVLCLSRDDPGVKAFAFDGFAEQVYAIEREGKIVSACVSARENDKCGEAWVFTSSDYRHQGLAQKVVNAWAGSLIRAGKVPFYSHKIDNLASANLARRLGLQPVFEEVVIARA